MTRRLAVRLKCVIKLGEDNAEHIRREAIKITRLGAHLLAVTFDCQGK